MSSSSVAELLKQSAEEWRVRRCRDAVADAVAELAPSMALIGVFLVAGYGIQVAFGFDGFMSTRWYTPVAVDFSVGALLLVVGALLAHRVRSVRTYAAALPALAGWRLAIAECTRHTVTPARVARLTAACLLTPLLFAVYGSWKTAIPRLMPFAWDEPIARAIEPLTGGIHPWVWLQPALGHPLITLAIDRTYASLFVVIVAVVLWQAWHNDPIARARFFLSFTLMWFLLGVVAATLVSSAGPCFYAGVAGGPDPYRPLLDYLARVDQQHPLIAVRTQELLWNAYTYHVPTSLTGISAFPSLHVGVAVLFTLTAFRHNWWLGIAFGAYTVATWIGSIHLGWHYAVDGYAAALGVTIIWIATGRMVSAHAGNIARTRGIPPARPSHQESPAPSADAA